MKKTIRVTIPASPERTKDMIVTHCDLCNKEGIAVCAICKRDICKECRRYDDNEHGDYPAIFCKRCHFLRFKKYEQDFSNLEIEHDEAYDSLWAEIKKETNK